MFAQFQHCLFCIYLLAYLGELATTQLYLRTLFILFLSPLPRGVPGGSGLWFSFRRRDLGPDPGGRKFNFDFDLKHSWDYNPKPPRWGGCRPQTTRFTLGGLRRPDLPEKDPDGF